MKHYAVTTQKQLRKEFWETNPSLKRVPGRTQNQYTTNVRLAWCDFVEMMMRSDIISESLGNRATL